VKGLKGAYLLPFFLHVAMEERLIQYLAQFITKRRLQLINKVVSGRTRYLTVVLEDIYQPHNASAVLRSCDCFGIQDVHIIENKNQYRINPDVTLGSDKWLTLYKYKQSDNNTREAITRLKSAGYRIVATSPHKKHTSIENFDLHKGKAALLFGTELKGLSEEAISMADEFITIPMVGFTESLNISVTVAIILYVLTNRLGKTNIPWQMTLPEINQLKVQWIKNSIKRSDNIENFFTPNP
jgi:tRNA (guanosine-2'-O-)-methyltransferase